MKPWTPHEHNGVRTVRRIELTDDEVVFACTVCGWRYTKFRCPAITRSGKHCAQVYDPDSYGTCIIHKDILDWEQPGYQSHHVAKGG